MGGIGRDLARKAQVLGMKVVYHNRRRLSEEEERGVGEGVRYMAWEELLEGSDVLSLNLPLNEGTREIIGRREFGGMRRGVVIVNTSRGGVMDEGALVEYVFTSCPSTRVFAVWGLERAFGKRERGDC